MALSSDEIRKIKEELEATASIQKNLTTSFKDYTRLFSDTSKYARQINDATNKIAKGNELIADLQERISNNTDGQTDELEKELSITKDIVKENEKNLRQHKNNLKVLKEQRKSLTNIASALGGGIYKGLKNNWKEYQKFDKAARQTAISMGLGVSQVNNYRKSLNKVAATTADWGVSYGELANMQRSYSEELGRAVQLSDKELESISLISEGTLIGAKNAANLVSEMDRFGKSAIAAKDSVEETVNLAHKMGVNSTKVVEIMQKNLKMANKYHFKEGTKNISEMAAKSAKFKLEMESVGSMAEKLFEPEGAIEMAANLQVLGGEFSKLADPFSLMFKARNDMEGLQDSIIKATKGIATFNEESGEFSISAQELHRLRKVAEATNIPLDQLTETAYKYGRIDLAKKEIGVNIDEDYHDFITSAAKWDDDKKEWVVSVYNKDGVKTEKLIKNLNDSILEANMATEETLKERAKAAKTFDETWQNLIMKLKTVLLPILQGISQGLREPIIKLMEGLNKSELIERLQKFGNKLGNFAAKLGVFAGKIAEFVTKNPGWAIAIGGALSGLMKGAQWFANGVMLRMGFNSIGGGLGGIRGRASGGKTKLTGLNRMPKGGSAKYGDKTYKGGQILPKGLKYKNGKIINDAGKGFSKTLTKGGSKGFAKLGSKALGKSLLKKIPLLGVLAGVGFGVNRLMKGDAGGGLLELASGLVSVVPGVGTAASLGLDAAIVNRDLKRGKAPKTKPQTVVNTGINEANDFISRPNEGLTKINSADTLIGAKKGGPIDKMIGNEKTPTKITIEFKPLKIDFGPIELKINGNSLSVDDFEAKPGFIKELSKLIHEEVNKTISGGKLSPNTI